MMLGLGLVGFGGSNKAEAAPATTTLELRAYVPNGSGYRIDPNAYIRWTGGFWIQNNNPVKFRVTKGTTFSATAWATRWGLNTQGIRFAYRECAQRTWDLSIPRNAGSVVRYNLLLARNFWRYCR